MASGLYGSYKNKTLNYNYNPNTGGLVINGDIQNPNGYDANPMSLLNQGLAGQLSNMNPSSLSSFTKPRSMDNLLYVPDNAYASVAGSNASDVSMTGDNSGQGLLGSLWQGAKDFGNWATKPLSGTDMNPGKSFLDYGLSGLSGLASLYGAFKQSEYSDKMNKLAERQQGLYESQLARDNARKDLAQSRYEASFR